MQTVLVTGAAGFIGSNFVRRALCRDTGVRLVAVDKLTYAALQATLMDHLSEKPTPIVSMLHAPALEILRRCEWVAGQVCSGKLFAEAVPVLSLIGGGTAPAARLQSSAVSLRHATLQPQALLRALRGLDPLPLRDFQGKVEVTWIEYQTNTPQLVIQQVG